MFGALYKYIPSNNNRSEALQFFNIQYTNKSIQYIRIS